MTEKVSIRLIHKAEDLPLMECRDFFHSIAFFKMLENTPRQQPFMCIAETPDGHVVAHLLATMSSHRVWLPPFVYTHGRVYGEGEYENDTDKEAIFGRFLNAITQRFNSRICLYIEFSDLSTKMFAYRHFRKNGYFPVTWQEIHNSLHSKSPKERLGTRLFEKVEYAKKRGVTTTLVTDGQQLQEAYKLLKSHFRLKTRRSVPSIVLFKQMLSDSHCNIFATQFKGRTIGCCVCINSKKDTFMWYLASLKKTFRHLHPNLVTVWDAMNCAYGAQREHFRFMDAGLPFKKNPAREFILGFGGKPVSKFRWFRLPVPWLNKLLAWYYND